MDILKGETDPPGSFRLPNGDEEKDTLEGDGECVSNKFRNQDGNVRPAQIIPGARTREDSSDPYADRAANLHERNCREAFDKSHRREPEGKFYCIYSDDGFPQLVSLAFLFVEEIVHSLRSNPGSLGDSSRTPVGLMVSGETHLKPFLTVHENLRFIRKLCGRPKSQVQHQIQVLSEILQLPNENCRIANLPKSETDRVTLASVLTTSPYLLIIQKPTMEQDRSMKERILDLLRTLSREEEVAILLFTDDPEEAAQADDVTIVVNGWLMARDSPSRLLEEFQCVTLKEVFETLHEEGVCEIVMHHVSLESVSALEIEEKTAPMYDASSAVKHTVASEKIPLGSIGETQQLDVFSASLYRIFLLLLNKLIDFNRHIFFIALMPFLMCLSLSSIAIIEKCPNSFRPELPVALVKSNSTSSLVDSFLASLKIGHLPFISSPNDTSLHRPYGDLDEALASLERGETCAVMRVGGDFSSAPHYQFVLRSRADENNASIESVLDIDVDAKSQEIRFILQRAIVRAAQKLPSRINKATNGSKAEIESRLRDPVFGSRSISHIEFLAPSIFIHTTLVTAAILAEIGAIFSAADIIRARFTPVGVKSREIAISEFFHLLCVLFVKMGLILFCMCLLNWNDLLPLKGSLVLAILLILMQGLLGIAVGLTTSLLNLLFFRSWFVSFTATFSFRAAFVLLASIGPRVRFARIVRGINCFILPTTSTESLRNIMYRGCGLYENDVLGAFIGLATRIVVLSLLATFLLKFLRHARINHKHALIQNFWGLLVKFSEKNLRPLIQKSRLR